MASKIYSEKSWAKTRLGTDIELFAARPLTDLEEPLLILGGVHGDEPEGVWLATYVLEMMKQSPNETWSQDWILIPCWNVDGFKINQRVNSGGVDLNRNFPSPNWTTEARGPRYYPGPSAASEPETQALMKLIIDTQPHLIIHCHSWDPCIVYTCDRAPKEAEILARSSKYELKGTIGYDTPGSLGQWGWHGNKIPVICIEEQQGEKKENIWPHFEWAFRSILLK